MSSQTNSVGIGWHFTEVGKLPQPLINFDMSEINITHMGNKRIWELSSNRSNRAGAKIGKKDPGEKFGGEDEYNGKPVYYSQVNPDGQPHWADCR